MNHRAQRKSQHAKSDLGTTDKPQQLDVTTAVTAVTAATALPSTALQQPATAAAAANNPLQNTGVVTAVVAPAAGTGLDHSGNNSNKRGSNGNGASTTRHMEKANARAEAALNVPPSSNNISGGLMINLSVIPPAANSIPMPIPNLNVQGGGGGGSSGVNGGS